MNGDKLIDQIRHAAELVSQHRASFPNPDWELAALYRAIALHRTEGPQTASEYLIAALGRDWAERISERRTASQASPQPCFRPKGAFSLSEPQTSFQAQQAGGFHRW